MHLGQSKKKEFAITDGSQSQTEKSALPLPNIEVPVYAARPIRYLGLNQVAGWQIKTYGINHQGEFPSRQLCNAALKLAESFLPQPAVAENRYGITVLTVHQAREGGFVLLN